MPNDITLPGAIANGDLSTRQFYAVRLSNSSGNPFEVAAISTGGMGSRPIGILQNDPNSCGQGAEVMLSGVSKVALGGNVTQGDQLTNDCAGRIVGITLSSGQNTTGQYVFGVALQSGNTTAIIYAVIHQPYIVQTS